MPDYAEPFDRDERGLRLARDVGGPIAEHAPLFLGRLVVAGIHASLESAAVGQRLLGFLHTAAPRSEKLRAIEAVAEWTLSVARHTRAAPERLEPERDRLRQHVLPHWPDAPAELADELAAVPAVFQHGDLGSWNVVVRPGGFTVLDWEDALPHAPPLWDLWYLLADALAHLDGAAGPDTRERHFVRLFRGELPGSEILFRWTRQTVEALEHPRRHGLDAGDPLLARRRAGPPRAPERDRAVRTRYRAGADAVRADRRALALDAGARSRLEQLAALRLRGVEQRRADRLDVLAGEAWVQRQRQRAVGDRLGVRQAALGGVVAEAVDRRVVDARLDSLDA